MIFTDRDLHNMFKVHRVMEKYMGVRIKKIKSSGKNYMLKNGIDIDEILSSRFIPGRISSDIKRNTQLDFHIEGIVKNFIINIFLFNKKNYRDSSTASLSSFKATEEDEYVATYEISTSDSSSDLSIPSSDEFGSLATRGGGKVGKRKQYKNLDKKTFSDMEISDNIYGSDIVHMLEDGLTYVSTCRTARREFSVILYPSDRRKELPSVKRYKDEFITEDNINSGMTIVNMNSAKRSISAVVRREEMFKVFLHELVHASLIDINVFGYYSSDLISLEERIRKDLRISQATPLAIGESATEILAEQMYILFVSMRIPGLLFPDRQLNTIPSSYMVNQTRRELEFCILQILKILYFYGFRTVGEFLKRNKSSRSMPKLASPTNIFGYIFLRYGLLERFYEDTIASLRLQPSDTSIYDKVKSDKSLVKAIYRDGYRRLMARLSDLEQQPVAGDETGSILGLVLDYEGRFPDIYETSLRFLSCEEYGCSSTLGIPK